MNRRSFSLSALRHFAAILLLGPLAALAQDDPKVNSHPAAKVVRDYLQLFLQREWNKSASLVDPKSLKQLHADFLRRLKSAPTMDDELEMTRRVGKDSFTAVEEMSPMDFYTAYHAGMQERWKVSPEVLKKVRDSLTVRLLSIGEEDPDHVHVLVITKHSNDKAIIENIELISLIKLDGAWRVTLNGQEPRITPLDSALPGAPPAAKPAPDQPAAPAKAPAKPKSPKGK